MSLLYECINTVIAVLISISTGMPSHSASIQVPPTDPLSFQRIRYFQKKSTHFPFFDLAVCSEVAYFDRRL
jgi:hypothetical protein